MTNYLLMNVVSLITSALLLLALVYYFWEFKKFEKKSRKINLFFVLGVTVSLFIAFVLSIVGLSLSAANIDKQPIAALIVWIISIVVIVASIVLLFWKLQYFAIALTDQSIIFLGERILFSSIKSIIKDKKTSKIFIFYNQGKRVVKKIVISPGFVNEDFFSEAITGIKIESKDAHAYYNELLKK